MLKSNFADIANSVSGPKAGSSRAACFLKEFTMEKHYSHFDVAATADKDNIGTGIILRTLYNIAKSQ
jgi:leucyl aminopeptidase